MAGNDVSSDFEGFTHDQSEIDDDQPHGAGGRWRRNLQDGRSRTMLVVLGGGMLFVAAALAFLLSGGDGEAPASSTRSPPSDTPELLDEDVLPTQERLRQRAQEDQERADEAEQTGRSAALRPTSEGAFSFEDFGDIPVRDIPENETTDDTSRITRPERQMPGDVVPRDREAERRAAQRRRSQEEIERERQAREARQERLAEAAAAKREEMIAVMRQVNSLEGAGTFQMQTQSDAEGGPGGPGGMTGPRDVAPRQADSGAEDRGHRDGDTEVLIPAGSLVYASMEDTADSDLKAPIFARLASGPLAGARVRGTFQVGQQQRCLVIRFDQLTIDGQESVSIDGLGVNPEDGTACLVSERNGRYIQRFGGVIAAGVAGGLGEAARLSAQGATVTTPQGGTIQSPAEISSRETAGLIAGNVAEESREVISSLILTQPQVLVAQGTPIGVRFLSDVLQERGRQ